MDRQRVRVLAGKFRRAEDAAARTAVADELLAYGLRGAATLYDAARDHAKDMVEKKFFAHDSPVPGKKTPWARAKRFGTSAHAENIAAGANTGADTIRLWWYSPGHHKNMMGGHARVGLGRHKKTWTQLFG